MSYLMKDLYFPICFCNQSVVIWLFNKGIKLFASHINVALMCNYRCISLLVHQSLTNSSFLTVGCNILYLPYSVKWKSIDLCWILNDFLLKLGFVTSNFLENIYSLNYADFPSIDTFKNIPLRSALLNAYFSFCHIES